VKKFYSIVLVMILALTPFAEAKTCYINECNYITNGGFASGSLSSWTTGGGGTVTTVNDPCYGSKAAQLGNTQWIQQSMYVDDTYTGGFSLQFKLYLNNDTNNFYDQLTIRVTNNDTGVSETFYIHGNSFSTNCSGATQVINLSNDYSLHNTTVRFENAYLATGTYLIDDVALWATY